MANTKTKNKENKFSFILLIGLLLAVGYFAISIINVNMDIKSRKKEVTKLNAQYEEQLAEMLSFRQWQTAAIRMSMLSALPVKSLAMLNPAKKSITTLLPATDFLGLEEIELICLK